MGQQDTDPTAATSPPRQDAAAHLSLTTRISTSGSRCGILSSDKTLHYLHLLLIKKGKEIPRALTTRGKKKNKERKKRKGKRKRERKRSAL